MEPKRPCYRSRFTCKLCKQSLGYSAFCRHQDLPHIYCPGHISTIAPAKDDSFNSTFEFNNLETYDSPTNESVNDVLPDSLNDEHSSTSVSSPESESSSDDSGPEVWDKTDESGSDSDTEAKESSPFHQLTYFACLFLSFFQLCFHISDKALSLLLLPC